MSRRTLTLMAVVLVAATAITAATAFAEPRKKLPLLDPDSVAAQQAADAVNLSSEEILRLKLRRLPPLRQKPPVTVPPPVTNLR